MQQLTDLVFGEVGVVVQVTGGYELKQKLALRGIKEGNWVRIISSSRSPIVVETDGGQVALGRGIAQKVIVSKHG